MILVWPGLSIETFSALIGVFFVAIGAFRIIVGAMESGLDAATRVISIVLGLAVGVLGLVAIRNPGLGLLAVALMVGIAWVMEGVVALSTLPAKGAGRGWWIAFGIVSLLAGGTIVLWPVASILPLLIVTGAFLLVSGVLDLINGVLFGRVRRAISTPTDFPIHAG
jgi:uncharacterized membrane protein HdeD (DUF308 family)